MNTIRDSYSWIEAHSERGKLVLEVIRGWRISEEIGKCLLGNLRGLQLTH